MHRVAVIDYGMGNLRSVAKALETIAPKAHIDVTSEAEKILSADHIVFPGVGAIRDCMSELKRLALDDIIKQAATQKPFLGICLGMQALMTDSEENNGIQGLDIIKGHVRRFEMSAENAHLKIPHMGWNQVHQTGDHPLWKTIKQDSRFYFVHSYFVSPNETSVSAALTSYPEHFTSAVQKDNLFAVQFHPEKSQHDGLKLLENFLNWDGQS